MNIFLRKKIISKYGHRRTWTLGMGPIVLIQTHLLPLDLNILTKSYKTRKHFKRLLGHFHLNILPHVPQMHYYQDRTQYFLPPVCSSLFIVTV